MLEPDALALLPCLTSAQQSERLSLLRDAVGVFTAARAAVYVDIGHSGWLSVDTAVSRLRAVGADRARGVARDVSGTRWSDDEVHYARELATRLPGLHAVVDTSRDGHGPTAGRAWCNPAGRGFGISPQAVVDAVVDAFVWVKPPGESDADSGRDEPTAGSFFPSYAPRLWARRA